MKRLLVVVATLAALARPALGRAEEPQVVSPAAGVTSPTAERGQVDASELTHLLVEKGLVTPQDEETLRHRMGAPSLDEAMQDYFDTPPYRREGWRGGP
jgi:hypothetical protein